MNYIFGLTQRNHIKQMKDKRTAVSGPVNCYVWQFPDPEIANLWDFPDPEIAK